MMKQRSNFVLRTFTGAIFVMVILASMLNFWSFCAVMTVLMVLSVYEYQQLIRQNNHRFNHSSWIYLYISVPFACLVFMHSIDPMFPLAVFTFVWVHDTFSYLSGMAFGKTKLCERISPKKTWEGFFGGFTASILTGLAFCYFTTGQLALSETLIWIGMAIVVIVAGTIGDLLESAFKRRLQVKDSGTLLPGHGGFLDRLDSVLLAAPVALIYLLLVSYFSGVKI
ncbi:MAG: phosphatidate cytidylyltransferase [Bacteroidales bacterium]|jgi:phosphatidate cytidylyltransferase|nr:phosphatidate cytidylyltransferase [Bacteroidales bacterium]